MVSMVLVFTVFGVLETGLEVLPRLEIVCETMVVVLLKAAHLRAEVRQSSAAVQCRGLSTVILLRGWEGGSAWISL